MLVVAKRSELTAALHPWRDDRLRISLVPTMGALHEGHLALVRAARACGAGRIVLSIFVNPRQFEDDADLARYPVDRERDLALAEREGVDLVWAPTVDDVYAGDHATTIHVGGPSNGFEGSSRPGHFNGVATVVTILFGAVRPDEAWFGEKDWQQLQVVHRLVADLALPVVVRALPTVREADGLALSSRNRFLHPDARRAAPAVQHLLRGLAARLVSGDDAEQMIAEGSATMERAGFVVDYLSLVRGDTMEPVRSLEPNARLIVAARLGTVRLLDNVGFD